MLPFWWNKDEYNCGVLNPLGSLRCPSHTPSKRKRLTTKQVISPSALQSGQNVRWPRHLLPPVSNGEYVDGTDGQVEHYLRYSKSVFHFCLFFCLFVTFPFYNIRITERNDNIIILINNVLLRLNNKQSIIVMRCNSCRNSSVWLPVSINAGTNVYTILALSTPFCNIHIRYSNIRIFLRPNIRIRFFERLPAAVSSEHGCQRGRFFFVRCRKLTPGDKNEWHVYDGGTAYSASAWKDRPR